MTAVALVLAVVGVAVGLIGGALAGWRSGVWALGDPKRYWRLNAAAVIGSLALDNVGLYLHQPWLAYGALGLMAGLITGLKYGYEPILRMWETQPLVAEEPSSETADTQTAPDEDRD